MKHTSSNSDPTRNATSASKAATWRSFPFTSICLVLIFVLSFFNPPHTALDNVDYIDKWTHLVMYGGTVCVFMLEYWRAHKHKRLSLSWPSLYFYGIIAPVVLGGIIELLQAYCTGGRRSGEWLDWIADSLGAIVAFFICKFLLLRSSQA